MNILPGTHLGRYEVLSKLGAGAMGDVYLAHDSNLSRTVALKVLPKNLAADEGRMEYDVARWSSIELPPAICSRQKCRYANVNVVTDKRFSALRKHRQIWRIYLQLFNQRRTWPATKNVL